MKKFIAIGLVIVLALSLGAGSVFAAGKGPIPSIDVSKIAEAVSDGIISNVTIENTGDMMVNVTSVTDTVYYKIGDSDWTELANNEDVSGYEIEVGDTLKLDYFIECEVPEEATELRNVVEVEIQDRDKVFQDIVSFLPLDYIEEIEELEAETESVAEPVSAVKGQGQSGKSHSWHVNLYQKDSSDWSIVDGGAWGRLNCKIKDGMLTGVFNGKGLESGVEYCLINYIEPAQNPWPAEGTAVVCLGSGIANKAGKVHIKAEGQIGEPDEMPETGDYVGQTGDKIWLVPCDDLNDALDMIEAWNPDSYLFEDVLINTE